MCHHVTLITVCDYYNGVRWQAMIGLMMDGKVQQPKYDFDCEEFRYNHRFSQFVCLTTPPPLPYAQYKVSHLFVVDTVSAQSPVSTTRVDGPS